MVKGPELKHCQELVKRYKLKNIEFKGFMTLEELNYYYNATDINLGLFNIGARANSVILNKTNDAFRVGKPHLTLETDAMKEVFRDNHDIFFVKDIEPLSLAERILELKNNPTLIKSVADESLKTYDAILSNAKATQILNDTIYTPLEESIK